MAVAASATIEETEIQQSSKDHAKPSTTSKHSQMSQDLASPYRHIMPVPRLLYNDICEVTRFLWVHRKPALVHLLGGPVLGALIVWFAFATDPFGASEYCVPGGDFDINRSYKPFSAKHAFEITLGFGKLQFWEAKLIDVVWDICVGRGGQSLLALMTFVIFTKSLKKILQERADSVTIELYQATVFREASLVSLWKMGAGITSKMNFKTILRIVWMILASAYVLSFSTWMSAMTGYTSNVVPYINTYQNESRVAWAPSEVICTVHDGSRIGENNDYTFGSRGRSISEQLGREISDCKYECYT